LVIMINAEQARAAARSIADATLGGPAGPMDRLASRSHYVFVSSTLVVKIIDAGDHARLGREIALAVALPSGLAAPVLASGRHVTEAGEVRYACVARLPGNSPGMGLAGVDCRTAGRWAREAVQQLRRLHDWVPESPAATVLRERLDHGGFVGRRRLLDEIERVRHLDDGTVVPRPILDGLAEIAERAPEHADTSVPVHADCHWDNWLVHDGRVTALLDFEWARFGEPADDWMFLARFSGPHMPAVLSVISDATATPLETLRAACEVREASHVTADLRLALEQSDAHARAAAGSLVRELEELVLGRSWWRPGRPALN
jgi:hypothetical protein